MTGSNENSPIKLPKPKIPTLIAVPDEEFKAALKLLGIPEREVKDVCALSFIKTDGKGGLVFSRRHKITPINGFDKPPGDKRVRGTITTVSSIPVEGSNCPIVCSGSFCWECCDI
jgi:hypothetical protein